MVRSYKLINPERCVISVQGRELSSSQYPSPSVELRLQKNFLFLSRETWESHPVGLVPAGASRLETHVGLGFACEEGSYGCIPLMSTFDHGVAGLSQTEEAASQVFSWRNGPWGDPSAHVLHLNSEFLLFFLFLMFFGVDLQCCVSFKCAAKLITYTYMFVCCA